MPIRETDRRKQERQQLAEQLKRCDEHLRDRDWIERISHNEDWKKLCELFRLETMTATGALEDLRRDLCRKPMGPDQRVLLAEQVMLMERDRENCENLIRFPQAEVERLESIQKEYPKMQERLKELEALEMKEETTHV